ncbi:hypothetical protein P40_10105 [Alloalcanivorax xenomutans]|nr:hypothetical protein P40_10105 [Alloalcanivorax xenomutans]ERS05695.1 hypothetical protein Q668_05510 [Alcanivorax sp. PN-3]
MQAQSIYQLILILVALLSIGPMIGAVLLAKKKTSTPKTTIFVCFILCFLPPLPYIYVAILSLKKDI